MRTIFFREKKTLLSFFFSTVDSPLFFSFLSLFSPPSHTKKKKKPTNHASLCDTVRERRSFRP
jgi:hypothetical protein